MSATHAANLLTARGTSSTDVLRYTWQSSVDGGKSVVDSRDEGKHTGRNDLLFIEKMMWVDE